MTLEELTAFLKKHHINSIEELVSLIEAGDSFSFEHEDAVDEWECMAASRQASDMLVRL